MACEQYIQSSQKSKESLPEVILYNVDLFVRLSDEDWVDCILFLFLEVGLYDETRQRLGKEITCCACELSMSGFG